MRKAVGEVVGQSRPHGDLGHNAADEGRRRFGQSEEPGKSALEDHSPDMGPGKGVLNHWGPEGYGCNPVEHMDVGRGTLRNKNRLLFNSLLEIISRYKEKHSKFSSVPHKMFITRYSFYRTLTCGIL